MKSYLENPSLALYLNNNHINNKKISFLPHYQLKPVKKRQTRHGRHFHILQNWGMKILENMKQAELRFSRFYSRGKLSASKWARRVRILLSTLFLKLLLFKKNLSSFCLKNTSGSRNVRNRVRVCSKSKIEWKII